MIVDTMSTYTKQLWARRWLRITGSVVGPIAVYLLMGNILHLWVFPSDAADPKTYPQVGDTFRSKVGGNASTIVAIEDDWAVLETILDPGAPGLPLHFHNGFPEVFVVQEGRLSVQLEDRVIKLGVGDTYEVTPGTPHRPFNPTDRRVVIYSGEPTMPLSFAACLVQVYAFVEDGPSDFQMAMQMSVIDPICDTHLAEIPVPVRVLSKVALAPIARLAGYQGYDRSRSLRP